MGLYLEELDPVLRAHSVETPAWVCPPVPLYRRAPLVFQVSPSVYESPD
jgi:hypothetical protein